MIRDRRDLKGVGTFGVDGHRKCPLSVRPGTQIVGLGAASRAVAVTCPGEPVMQEFNCNPFRMDASSFSWILMPVRVLLQVRLIMTDIVIFLCLSIF
jgi:hypothetical protein